MKVLFVHPNQPSQFQFIAEKLAEDTANEVIILSRLNLDVKVKGVKVYGFMEGKYPNGKGTPFTKGFVEGSHRAVAAAEECMKLKKNGFIPDVMVAHSGWGDGFYLKSVFPDTPLLNYMEFYSQPAGTDLDFSPRSRISPYDIASSSTLNAIHALNFFNADWCISPTYWQRSVHPKEMHNKISVLHEGIDTKACRPDEFPFLMLPSGVKLYPKKDEIITHVERFFDVYRGFPSFIKGIELIQKNRPNAHVLIVGDFGVGYSKNGTKNQNSMQQLVKNSQLDSNRTHWLGYLNHNNYIRILQASSAHIYLSYPYVLSWSFLEAMSVGCPIVCSNTQPIREIAENEKNCLMFDFHKPKELADSVITLMDDRDYAKKLGVAAREKIIAEYDRTKILSLYLDLINGLADGKPGNEASETITEWNNTLGRNDRIWQESIPLFGSRL
jgi:glycosyltransferase involved in cell wall biosynthesis